MQSLQVAGWRREVHELYRQIRDSSDPAAAHADWVAARERMFATHPASARMPGQRLAHASYDPAYRLTAQVEPTDPGTWEYPTATDGVVPFSRVGRVQLGSLGVLDVWWLESYGGGVFIPFKDTTNGQTSYGAGRYLLDTVKGADLGRISTGEWVLDLNFAYNPSCAYNPMWACPLAPAGNRLSLPVPVGELAVRT